jgi:hypothetical protein
MNEAEVREIEGAIAEAIGRTRRELQQQIDELRRELAMERRMAALEARNAGPILDAEPIDLPDWRSRLRAVNE